MSDVETLQAEVEARRRELERTASALGDKLDVKARGARAAHRAQDAVTTPAGRPRPPLVAGAVALVAIAGIVWWWRSR